jgi:hypothetical protein
MSTQVQSFHGLGTLFGSAIAAVDYDCGLLLILLWIHQQDWKKRLIIRDACFADYFHRVCLSGPKNILTLYVSLE